MALVFNDRVKETSTTTGTGTLDLGGAFQDFQTFVAGIGNSNETYYNIVLPQTGEFEVGRGVVTDASPDTLSRLEVFTSSNNGNLVDFSAGTKTVFCTLPANKFVPGKFGGTNFSDSILVGHSTTGTLSTASNNTGLGIQALQSLTSGDDNTAVGKNAGVAVNSGIRNSLLGRNAGEAITTGSQNTAFGHHALRANISSDKNTAIGAFSLLAATGAFNIGIGKGAGSNITSGAGNVIIGGDIDAASATGDRQLKIGGHDGSTTTTWISGDNTGALTFADKVVLGANKVIEFGDSSDTIKGDGTKITVNSSGRLDLLGTSVYLNGSGTTAVLFSSQGVQFGELTKENGTDLVLKSSVSDGDLVLRGNDGGSAIDALSFDMSEAGAATFNAGITATTGTISGDLTVDTNTLHVDSSNNRVGINTTSPTQALTIDGGNNAKIQFLGGGFQSIYYGDSGTNVRAFVHYDHNSDNYQIDVPVTATIDAPSGLRLADSGTQFGQLEDSSNDFVISSSVQDKDIIFKGNDGGSTITALRLDMSTKGRVTIGSNNFPAERLSVFGEDNTAAATFKVKDTDSRGVLIESPYSGFGVGYVGTDGTNSALGFKVNGTEVGRFGTNGFLGIGTNNPQEEIHINGADPSIRIQDSDGGLATITQAGNNLSFDVPGVIQLDAGGASIEFLDDGLSFLKIENSSSDAHLRSIVQDKDILLRGNDGGSQITALTLDMSEAGAATFNDKIILGANKVIEFGDSGETISGDGTDMTVSSSGILNLNSSAATGPAIRLSSSAGGVSVESNSLIVLDAHNADNGIQYKDGATEMLRIHNSSSDVILHTKVQDKDLIFKGNDGGSDITALTLDMSAAGAATFNDKVILGANKSIEFGDAGETITGDGTNLTILSSGYMEVKSTGNLLLDSTNGSIFLRDTTLNLLQVFKSGTTDTILKQPLSDGDLTIRGNDGGSDVDALIFDMSEAGAATFNSSVTVGANLDVSSGTIKLDGNYPTGTDNLALGDTALDSVTSGDQNTAIGSIALTALTTASFNTAIGYKALEDNISGTKNTAIGSNAASNTTGANNVAIGVRTLFFNTSGHKNTAVGEEALLNGTSAERNTAVGYQAGASVSGGSNLTIIGYQAEPSSGSAINEITLGNSSVTSLRIPGLQSGASSGDVLTFDGTDIGFATPSGVSAGFAVAMAIAL